MSTDLGSNHEPVLHIETTENSQARDHPQSEGDPCQSQTYRKASKQLPLAEHVVRIGKQERKRSTIDRSSGAGFLLCVLRSRKGSGS